VSVKSVRGVFANSILWHQYCDVEVNLQKQDIVSKYTKLNLNSIMDQGNFDGQSGAGFPSILTSVTNARMARYTFVDVTFKLLSVSTDLTGDSAAAGKTTWTTSKWPIYCMLDQYKKWDAVFDWNWIKGTPPGFRKIFQGQAITFRYRRRKNPITWTHDFTSASWPKELDNMMAKSGLGMKRTSWNKVGDAYSAVTSMDPFGTVFYAFPGSMIDPLSNPKLPSQWNLQWEVTVRAGLQWSSKANATIPGVEAASAPPFTPTASMDSCEEAQECLADFCAIEGCTSGAHT